MYFKAAFSFWVLCLVPLRLLAISNNHGSVELAEEIV